METVELRDLLVAARVGDQNAWDTLVERFMPLVLSIARRFRLPEKDVEDVSQTVWLRLAENLHAIREPRALPGWISTTTRHEALAVIKTARRSSSLDPGGSWMAALPTESAGVDEDLLRAERQHALREGLAELKPEQRQLLLLLASDPPISYEDASRRLGMPIGSIGPTRARYLKKLRETSAVRNFFDVRSDTNTAGGAPR
jgi:RNA polymerase sigma factor (sigma-70 family)